MKIASTLLLLCLSLSFAAHAEQTVSLSPDRLSAQTGDPGAEDSPAKRRLQAAEHQLQIDPKNIRACNDLALAYLRRARETANTKYLDDAERAIARGLAVDAKDFALQKTQAVLLLAQLRYTEAEGKAAQLNRRMPDDVAVYGYLADAQIALGEYAKAEKSAQWMLNMLPNNVPGLLLGARLRIVYGDPEGALELLNLAYTETSPTEVEELAWIGNQIAAVQIGSGKLEAATAMLTRSEQLFPHYVSTTENLARVRLAEHRPDDAITLFQVAAANDTDPHMLYELATANADAGHPTEARAAFTQFEKSAGASLRRSDAATRDLILMKANDTPTAPLALQLAQSEVAVRQDVWTLDAYAWALYANGKYQEADTTIRRVLALGIQNTQIFNHAEQIAQKLNHQADATRYADLAGRLTPSPAALTEAGRLPARTQPSPNVQEPETLTSAQVHQSPPFMAESLARITPFSPVAASLLTPHATETDRRIRNAQALVSRNEKDAAALAGLGAAYLQRARETGNVDDYQLAERSLTKSLDVVSSDFSADAALTSMAELCMGEHRFADALMYAQKALALGSGDVSPFAIVGDAYADMGEYAKAKLAYARLTPREMTLSPRAAYARDSRLSYLKFVIGDTPGAIALMKVAVAEGTAAQLPSENLAWLYYELGEFLTESGDTNSADQAYVTALTIHPGDYRALAALGKLRANHGSYAEAIMLYQRAIAIVPMPLFVAELGDLYAKSNDQTLAKQQYQVVEYIGLLGSINQVLHNRDLAIFYADRDIKLPEALRLAQKEFEVRHDIYTWDALAWALYKNGRPEDAVKASEKALQFGTRDSLLLFHAGMIAEALGKREQARSDWTQALEINPHFHLLYAGAAQQKLASMAAQTVTAARTSDHAR